MGLTIHYALRSDAASPEPARQQVEQLRQAALDIAMSEVGEVVEFSESDCHFETAEDESLRWLLVQARRLMPIGEAYHFVVPIRVFAFSTWPGEGCEAANFGLALYPDTVESEEGMLTMGLSGWSWQSFCKTQYSSNPDIGGMVNFVRCHVAVVRLLDRAKAMGILEGVKNESHFWDRRSLKCHWTPDRYLRKSRGLGAEPPGTLQSDEPYTSIRSGKFQNQCGCRTRSPPGTTPVVAPKGRVAFSEEEQDETLNWPRAVARFVFCGRPFVG